MHFGLKILTEENKQGMLIIFVLHIKDIFPKHQNNTNKWKNVDRKFLKTFLESCGGDSS